MFPEDHNSGVDWFKYQVLGRMYYYDPAYRVIGNRSTFSNALSHTLNGSDYRLNFGTMDDTYYNERPSYDANGNILAIKRFDYRANANTTGNPKTLMDSLMYSYVSLGLGGAIKTNKIASVAETLATGINVGFTRDIDRPGYTMTMLHDNSGRMTVDRTSGHQAYTWTHDGLLREMSDMTLPGNTKSYKYLYDAFGRKVRQTRNIPQLPLDPIQMTYYSRGEEGSILAVYESNTQVTEEESGVEFCFKYLVRCPAYFLNEWIEVCTDDFYWDVENNKIIIEELDIKDCGGNILTAEDIEIDLDERTVNYEYSTIMISRFAYNGTDYDVKDGRIVRNNTNYPKLSEWHIYGLQGNFLIRKPEVPVKHMDPLSLEYKDNLYSRFMGLHNYSIAEIRV